MRDLSIIIVTWNSEEEIVSCLSSVLSSSMKFDIEVLVVDNGSSDETIQKVQRFQGVRVIETGANLGFARANNLGINQSSGRLVLLLNPDTVVLGNALDVLIDYIDGQSKAGAVGPRLVKSDGNVQSSCLRTPSIKSQLMGYVRGGRYLPKDQTQSSEVEVVSGAALLVKREVIADVGCLDSDYFMYAEEVDWCYRIRRSGWEIHYYPLASIIHLGGSSARKVGVQTYVHRRVSRLLFLFKHRPTYAYKTVRFLIESNIAYRLFKSKGDANEFYRAVYSLYEQEIAKLEHLSLNDDENGLHSNCG